jgi:hypothetical protein
MAISGRSGDTSWPGSTVRRATVPAISARIRVYETLSSACWTAARAWATLADASSSWARADSTCSGAVSAASSRP